MRWRKWGRSSAEREVAWRALYALRCRAPFAATEGRRTGTDALVVEIVADSEAVLRTLTTLVESLPPASGLAAPAQDALFATAAVADLRADWVAHRDRDRGLSAGATDPYSEMCRVWVRDEEARAWPRYDEARSAVDAATTALLTLGREMAAVCGESRVLDRLAAA